MEQEILLARVPMSSWVSPAQRTFSPNKWLAHTSGSSIVPCDESSTREYSFFCVFLFAKFILLTCQHVLFLSHSVMHNDQLAIQFALPWFCFVEGGYLSCLSSVVIFGLFAGHLKFKTKPSAATPGHSNVLRTLLKFGGKITTPSVRGPNSGCTEAMNSLVIHWALVRPRCWRSTLPEILFLKWLVSLLIVVSDHSYEGCLDSTKGSEPKRTTCFYFSQKRLKSQFKILSDRSQ